MKLLVLLVAVVAIGTGIYIFSTARPAPDDPFSERSATETPAASVREVRYDRIQVAENNRSCQVDDICKITFENGTYFIYGKGLQPPEMADPYEGCSMMSEMFTVEEGQTLEVYGQLYPGSEIRFCGEQYYARLID